MIKYTEFTEILKTLLKAYDQSVVVEEEGVSNPKSIHLIDKIQTKIKDKKFVELKNTEEGVELFFKGNPDLYLVKKTDFAKVDPALYFKEKKKWSLDFKTSGIILLTDFAVHLYESATHKLFHSNLNHLGTVQDNFKRIGYDTDCFREIWQYSELNCFALVDQVEGKIYFVSDSAERIHALDKLFPSKSTAKTKASKKEIFVSDFLIDSYVEDNDLHAKVKLDGYKELIEVVFEFEKKKTDFSKEATFFKKILNKLTTAKQNELFNQVAEEITDAAFAETDNIKNKGKQNEELKKDLTIHQLIIIEEDVLLNLRSQQLFTNKDIIVQLDEDLSIVDISIPEISETE